MDLYTPRIIGFGIQVGIVDGLALCRMFNQAIRGQVIPKYLSSDHDPLYRFHQWQANLRVLGVTEIKTVAYVPLSHLVAGGSDSYQNAGIHGRQCQILSLAETLSRFVPNTNGCMSTNSPWTGCARPEGD
jgi:hypothetical protein